MGHGGTLDPMATGVLILGVGQGTKELGYFTTGCRKSYEAVVLFGVGTDTYDTEGKVLKRAAEYGHITRELVEEKLRAFKGKGVQRPPVFSALKVQGKKLYEYAREGKEVPVEIKERPVDASELEMVEWFEGGTHEWHWPKTEASAEEKAFADKLLSKTAAGKAAAEGRKRESEEDAEEAAPPLKRAKGEEESATATTEPTSTEEQPAASQPPCPAPACRIRMTVTSGFYVRTLCHDLGAAVGSFACMSNLVRTMQGGFELGSNVLWYDELKQGEDVWGPKVKAMIVENQARSEAKMKEENDEADVKRQNGEAEVGKDETEVKVEHDLVAPQPKAAKPAEVSETTSMSKEVHVKLEDVAAKAAPVENKWKAGY